MKVATAKDWNIEPLPDTYVTIELNFFYTEASRQKIINGFVPKEMEEKWFIYYDKGVLNFHRSWTGYCIYRITCSDDGKDLIFIRADVNRDPNQYTEKNDEHDRKQIEFLIDKLFLSKPLRDLEFIRIIPSQRFLGLPAQANRPYAFFADTESIKGKTIAESYRLVNGLGLPDDMESGTKHCTPYIWYGWPKSGVCSGDPISKIKVKKSNQIISEDLQLEDLEKIEFVILRISWSLAVHDLDVFPATWRALAYIVSDPKRMSAKSLSWNMSLSEYASASIHAHFREIHEGEKNLLALTKSKTNLGLTNLDDLPSKKEEMEYYSYLSKDSIFVDKIVDLFGISCRCWHGCGYLGPIGKPIVRFFWLRNIMSPFFQISVMKGRDLIAE